MNAWFCVLGFYGYVSTQESLGKRATFALPIKTPQTNSCFKFHYNMVAKGTLSVSNVHTLFKEYLISCLLKNMSLLTRAVCLPFTFHSVLTSVYMTLYLMNYFLIFSILNLKMSMFVALVWYTTILFLISPFLKETIYSFLSVDHVFRNATNTQPSVDAFERKQWHVAGSAAQPATWRQTHQHRRNCRSVD